MVADSALEVRFRELLGSSANATSAEALRFAADFVRLLVGATISAPDDYVRLHDRLRHVVQSRTALGDVEVDVLLRLVEAPEFRDLEDLREAEAFVGRFGAAAQAQLKEHEDADVDLAGYARTYGGSQSLLLLDAMFAVVVADNAVSGHDLRRLGAAAADLGIDGVLFSALHRKHDPRHAAGDLVFPLEGERLRIGRSPGADIVLPDPQVALRHAELILSGAGWRVVDAESGRPTVVNGRPVSAAPFAEGDELRLGPYVLRLNVAEGAVHAWGERSFTALSARRLSRHIGPVSLLDDVSFTAFSGEVIAMVGPSGAGKTTLLNAIAGITAAETGDVLLDGLDFHSILAADRSRVGVVPQDDIVHPELTVEESLTYSGRLRFSPDTSRAEVSAEVDRVLAELGIAHIRSQRIGDAFTRGISGGQRKRVNLGQEMLTRSTRVLFLDEPTSGLDPRAAQDIVRLVRQLADRGRIVFLVTHDLSPQVMAQVDHLLVLAPGGRLAFFGPPAEACEYFRVPTPDAIFNRFSDRSPAEWGTHFRESPAFQKYVTTRENLLAFDVGRPVADLPPSRSGRSPHHLRTLIERYWRVKQRDRIGVRVLAAQPPFLALVMAIVFPKPTMSMMFMLSLSCLWFGMSGAVRELISDRVVWRRERRVGVGVRAYVGSKLAVLGLLAVTQCTFLATLVFISQGLWAYGYSPVVLALVCSLTGLTGMTLGLLVSASFASSEAAVGTLPLLLIPQITFSALLVGLRDMTPIARLLTWVNPQRYAFDATLKAGEKLEKATRIAGKWELVSVNGPLYELGLKGADVADRGLPLVVLCFALCAFSLLFGGAALLRVYRREE